MSSPEKLKILITGGSGTLGLNIVRLLANNPDLAIVLPLRNLQPFLTAYMNVSVLQAELSDIDQMSAILAAVKPDVIVHCAAIGVRPARPEWYQMIDFNVATTLRLFEASCALSSCHFVYISSGLVYRPQNRPLCETDRTDTLHPYGATKSTAECLLQTGAAEYSRQLTILRPFSFTGLHDCEGRLFPSLLRAAVAQQPVRLSRGEQYRDFCCVQDIAAAVAAVINRKASGQTEIYNLGSGDLKTIREIIEGVCAHLALEADLRFGELPYHPFEPMHLVADISKAAQLPWRPTTNLAFAVWELAQSNFPQLRLRRPEANRFLSASA